MQGDTTSSPNTGDNKVHKLVLDGFWQCNRAENVSRHHTFVKCKPGRAKSRNSGPPLRVETPQSGEDSPAQCYRNRFDLPSRNQG